MFTRDREQLRGYFAAVWAKARREQGMEPLERIVADVIAEHPEYQPILEDPGSLERDFRPEAGEANPFLHMGMHVAIHEQLAADRPPGIRALYRHLLPRHDGAHALEHAMMECLGAWLWEASRSPRPPDERAYLECLRRIGRGRRRGQS